ncbi:hypothetical protein L208DRAFT_1244012, partial [Tricholoma matsutake]
ECLLKDWKSPVNAFYHPIPVVAYMNARQWHEFKCAAHGCKYISRQYLDKKDRASTGNIIKHAKQCWGEETWIAANQCQNAAEARSSVTGPVSSSGSITATFEQMGKGKVTYSHRMHTKTELKYVEDHSTTNLSQCRSEIVHWVSESA